MLGCKMVYGFSVGILLAFLKIYDGNTSAETARFGGQLLFERKFYVL